MHTPAAARVFAFGVFTDDDPVDFFAAGERAGNAGQHARRPHVGVLIEALADRQPQAPQRDMVGHVGRADRAKEYCVEGFQMIEAAVRNVIAVFLVISAAPRKLFDLEFEAAVTL